MTATLELRSIDVSFDDTEVVSGIDLMVGQGETVCLVGPSGCGKTTLLNVAGGLLPPTGGQVLVEGEAVTAPGPARVMVFQEDAVFPWLTVQRNVEYGLRVQGVAADRRNELVARALQAVGLADAAERLPRELSGGMRKRVDLARALAVQPNVLLMDEPYAALDAMTKERLQLEFLRLGEKYGTTAVFVTHDLEEAAFVGDRVVCLTRGPGRIQSVHDVPFERPRDARLKLEPGFQRLRGALMTEIAIATGEQAR